MKIKLLTAVTSIFCMFLVFAYLFSANAEKMTLPAGSVAGLPEKISVLDSDGKSPNDKGEYFFEVKNMEYGKTYTKKIQITNLRDDKSYHIYFYVEPVDKSGNIDLEKDVTCKMKLDGNEVFNGNVYGKGENKDLTKTPLDLGYYKPGASNTLFCSVEWSGLDINETIDEGAKLHDKNGITVLRDKSGNNRFSGEIKYKWKFYAVVDENYSPPYTGIIGTDGKIWIICIALALLFLAIIIILLIQKNIRKKKKANQH